MEPHEKTREPRRWGKIIGGKLLDLHGSYKGNEKDKEKKQGNPRESKGQLREVKGKLKGKTRESPTEIPRERKAQCKDHRER